METIDVEINKLKFAEYNPRQISEKDFEALKNSIKEFGFVVPIVVNSDNTIIGGHMRVRAAQAIGITSVPCFYVDLDKNKEKVLNIALNKISGEWDYDKLTGLLSEIEQFKDIDVSLTGFDDVEIGNIFDEYGLEEDPIDDEIPEIRKTDIKIGDLFQLGKHRLMCGDCMIKENVEKLMNGKKADMVFTDPPYGINLNTDFSDMKGMRGGKKYKKIIGDDKIYNPSHIFRDFGYCKEIFLWGADYYSELLPNRNNGSFFVWDKTENGISPNSIYEKQFGSNFELCWSKTKHKRQIIPCLWKGIFGLSKEDIRKRIHPTQKPLKLCEWFITKFNKKDNLIVDLFGGSGSTLITCEKTNRICYMMEIEPKYCQVIIDRWEQYTGKKALKL